MEPPGSSEPSGSRACDASPRSATGVQAARFVLPVPSVNASLFGLARHEQPRVGAVVAARYRIDHLLGTGSMGAVYRADDLALGRPIAIKVLHAHLGAHVEAVARFHRE